MFQLVVIIGLDWQIDLWTKRFSKFEISLEKRFIFEILAIVFAYWYIPCCTVLA